MLGRDATWIIREEERVTPEKRYGPLKEAADHREMKPPDAVRQWPAEERRREKHAAVV